MGRALAYIDWSRTKAYAVGLGGIYLNLAGREGEGIVDRKDAPALIAELRAKLLAAEDPEGGGKAVREVYVTSEIHSGPYLSEQPDLMAGFDAGWRVSWATTLGDIRLVESATPGLFEPAPVYEDNRLNWSGDHVSVAEELVRGIFFSNRKVAIPEGGVNLLHIAPTALAVLGVAVPAEYDVAPLTFRP
jgi:predicted AlkP superfamily phosphohydrolase/phosphomutase